MNRFYFFPLLFNCKQRGKLLKKTYGILRAKIFKLICLRGVFFLLETKSCMENVSQKWEARKNSVTPAGRSEPDIQTHHSVPSGSQVTGALFRNPQFPIAPIVHVHSSKSIKTVIYSFFRPFFKHTLEFARYVEKKRRETRPLYDGLALPHISSSWARATVLLFPFHACTDWFP